MLLINGVVGGGRYFFYCIGKFGEVITTGHDAEKIGFAGVVDNATVVKLFLR